MKKKDKINIILLITIFIAIVFFIVKFEYLNGSQVDWNSQHIMFPDYFRKLFYETKNLLPNFAFNLGAGENIYNFSYYGLLNPFILLSYLFPSISMPIYIIIMMIVIIIASIIICYKWLRNRFDSNYSFLGTLLFILSAPIIYHTHRHIMFIDYMPFLFLALIAVEKYFKNDNKFMLSLMIFLIIMTSYYYSITSIICIVLYGIFIYFEKNKLVTIKMFLRDGIKFLYPIIVGILSSCVLLLPTIYTILSGRSDITNKGDIISLLVPTIYIDQILYNSYTIGLSCILVFALLYGLLSKNKGLRFISIVLSLFVIFPIFMYLLNGGMYVRGKVLIPLLPICIFLITYVLNNLKNKNNKVFNIILIIVSILEIIIDINDNNKILSLDVIILLLTYFLYQKINNKKVIIYPLIIVSFIICISNNISEQFVLKSDYNVQFDKTNYEVIDKLIKDDKNVYRTANDLLGKRNINYVYNINTYLPSVYSSLVNKYYTEFTNDLIGNEMENEISTALMPSNNIIYNTYMGMKYLITDECNKGYSSISTNVCVNNNVLPIGYATDKVLGNIYKTLKYPDNIYAIFSNVVIDEDLDNNYISKIETEELEYDIINKNIEIKDDVIKVVDEKSNLILKLNKNYSDKILFIRFNMNYQEKCSIGNTSITINGITNTLSCKSWTYPNKNYTFDYVISGVEDTLNIEFSRGKYTLSDIEVYSMNYNDIVSFTNEVDEFIIDKEKTKGDYIEGDIDVTKDGYFILTIPYDKGFTIYVDDKLTDYEKVDTAFIGFKINSGNHNIKIKYTSPYKMNGMIISSVGIVMMIIFKLKEVKNERKNKKHI